MLDWIKSRLPFKKNAHSAGKKQAKTPDIAKRPKVRRAPANLTATIADARALGLDTRRISDNAVRVLQRLNDGGHEAFIVGGCVRDLLLDMRPKDFDIATSATPEQVRQVFKHSRIIGRRFRIVHVLFGRETIEVTTFRAHHDNAAHARDGSSTDSGLLLRDNVYGSLGEDALRRDFTVNALYYDAAGQVRDYCDGLADIGRRQIRMIGEPELRYREDPVRMLRGVRLAAKLGFTLEKSTAHPIAKLAPLLNDISNARLFDEMVKLFMGGAAVATFELMLQHQLFQVLFPQTAHGLVPGNYSDRLIRQALANTDTRLRDNLRVTPAFLCAALLWHAVQQQVQHALHAGEPPLQALHKAAHKVLGEQMKRIAIPKRFSQPMQEIWELQSQLIRRQAGRAEHLLEHPRFRAAYDFLLLREQAGEDLHGLGHWWTTYQEADITQREQMLRELQNTAPSGGKPRRRGGRGRRGPRKEAARE